MCCESKGYLIKFELKTLAIISMKQFESKLTDTEQQALESIYDGIKQKCILYHDGLGDCCWRLKRRPKLHQNPARKRYGHSPNLNDFGVAYGATFGKLRSKFDTNRLVHVCGNAFVSKNQKYSRCVNANHIILQSTAYNNSTITCHKKIREFESKHRQNAAIQTIGKLTIAFINSQVKKKHQPSEYRCPHWKNPCFIIFCGGKIN